MGFERKSRTSLVAASIYPGMCGLFVATASSTAYAGVGEAPLANWTSGGGGGANQLVPKSKSGLPAHKQGSQATAAGALPVLPWSPQPDGASRLALISDAASRQSMCLVADGGLDAAAPVPDPGCKDSGPTTADYGGPDGCVDADRVVCAHDEAYHVWSYQFEVSAAGQPIVLHTSNLAPLNGSAPDTLVYLLACADSGCSGGSIAAIDDDGSFATPLDPLDSWLSLTPAATGWYRAIVTDYYQGAEGLADVSLQWDGQSPLVFQAQVFGGYHIKDKEVRQGDGLYVAKNNNGMGLPEDPEYHDSVLYYFTTTSRECDGGSCGLFLHNDDQVYGPDLDGRMYLSRLDSIPGSHASTGRVLAGVWADRHYPSGVPARMNARVFHHRRSDQDGGAWSGVHHVDADGDGLTLEVEDQLGSCDSPAGAPAGGVGAAGYGCAGFQGLVDARVEAELGVGFCAHNPGDPRCWRPVDSDNDGLDDGWEVFGVTFECANQPIGPYYDAGACTAMALHDPTWCTPGKWCVTEALSARSDPDPLVYDAYYVNRAWSCDPANPYCAAGHAGPGAQTSHAITTEQQGLLPNLWTSDPGTCWNGGAPPCDDPVQDVPYRVRMHAYNLPDQQVQAHDEWDGELDFLGSDFTKGHFNRWFGGAVRYGRLVRFGFAGHNFGGQAPMTLSSHGLIWGNENGGGDDKYQVLGVLSHELGHTYTLGHAERVGVCDGCGVCKPAGQSCPNPPALCMPAAPCSLAAQENPNHASVMSYQYQYQGMLPKSGQRPQSWWPGQDAYCSEADYRFSKGVNEPLHEDALNDWQGPAGDWRAVKQTQDAYCYASDAICSGRNFGFAGGFGPYCDASSCWVNWKSDAEPPVAAEYAWDISRGDWDGVGQCSDDGIQDVDEWRKVVALGKQVLWNRPAWHPSFAIYMDTFNAGVVENLAAWDIPVDVTAPLVREQYPINACRGDADCGAGKMCIDDESACPGGCRIGQPCVSGRCSCSNNDQCFSSLCVSGVCSVEWGACSCASQWDCRAPANACAGGGACQTFYYWNDPPPGVLARPREYSAAFNGPTAVEHVRLVETGAESPLTSIPDGGAFWWRLDLRPDGMVPGQTSQTVISSNAFTLTLEPVGDELRLKATVPGLAALIAGGGAGGVTIRPGVWARVTWGHSVDLNRHFLDVRVWNITTGWYDAGLAESGCVYQTTPGAPPDPGDVWIGYDGSSSASRLSGRVDSVQLFNFNATATPAGCVVQP